MDVHLILHRIIRSLIHESQTPGPERIMGRAHGAVSSPRRPIHLEFQTGAGPQPWQSSDRSFDPSKAAERRAINAGPDLANITACKTTHQAKFAPGALALALATVHTTTMAEKHANTKLQWPSIDRDRGKQPK
jgi:hypothetical protein